MKADVESSRAPPAVVTDRRQATVVTDRAQLRLLAPFMGRETTVSAAARGLGQGVSATYKLAARLCGLGLLTETRRERRAGRAVRYYRAPAAFFVPFGVMGLEQVGERNRRAQLQRFERNLGAAVRHAFPADWGALTGVLPSGETYYEIAAPDGRPWNPLEEGGPLLLSGWNLLHLTPQQARTLQRDLLAVVTPYLHGEGTGDPYQLGIFLCRDQG